MKKLLVVFALFMSTGAFAQAGLKEDIDVGQAIWGKDKKDMMASYMKLAEPQAAAFWKVYDEYEVERKKLGRTRWEILNEYLKNYETLTEETADRLAEAQLKNNVSYEKLYANYYKKAKKVVGAVNAAKFIQLEMGFQTIIKEQTQAQIPFIGEMEREKKTQ